MDCLDYFRPPHRPAARGWRSRPACSTTPGRTVSGTCRALIFVRPCRSHAGQFDPSSHPRATLQLGAERLIQQVHRRAGYIEIARFV